MVKCCKQWIQTYIIYLNLNRLVSYPSQHGLCIIISLDWMMCINEIVIHSIWGHVKTNKRSKSNESLVGLGGTIL